MKLKKWMALSPVDKAFDIINYTLLALITVIFIYPLYCVILASFGTDLTKMRYWFDDFSLLAYKVALGSSDIWRAYCNSIFYAVGGVCVGLVLTIPCAYALSRKDLPGRNCLMAFVMFTMYFSGGMIPTYLAVQSYGLLNTWFVIIILTGVSAYNVIVARTFFASNIPDELYDASKVDGCGNWLFFWKIVLPLSKPILAVIALWIGVGKWNSYMTERIYLRDIEKQTLAVYLHRVIEQARYMEELMNGSGELGSSGLTVVDPEYLNLITAIRYVVIVVAALPMMMIYPFIQKYFAKGVMVGSVKG